MDPRSTAQDVHRCDLCETAIVHSYCDFCHVNLCKPCIGEHISDGYDKHKIVPFQERRSTLIYQKCEMHPQKNCKFQCKDCNNIVICSSCALSKQHKGHYFVELVEVYKTKKEDIEKDTKELENHISPTYEKIALEVEHQLANLDGGYEKLRTTISKHGEKWHKEIDIVINNVKTELNEIKVKHREILQKHLDEVKQIQSFIKQTLLALKELEQSTEVSSTIEYSSKIREFSKLPPKVMVTMPTFISKSIEPRKLYNLFGQLTSLSTATEEKVLSLSQPKSSVRKLFDEPELVATIKTGYYELCKVICLNEERIWVSGSNSDIKCFNLEGSLLQTIKTKSGEDPFDIALDSDENILYIDRKTLTVNKVKNGLTEEVIRLRGCNPVNLCVTSTEDILVFMYSVSKLRCQRRIVRYSGYREKQTIQFDSEGKLLYPGTSSTKCIENRNHDICVADCGAGAVVAVNQNGKFRWRYTGHSSVTRSRPFRPFGITTDSQSHVLTTDRDNHRIHILDQNGQFLHYIDTCNLNFPNGVCVDNNDNLFVCEEATCNLKKIRYLK
ncbi:E3 ubiquitin-protein ligase TRIM71-like [Magallana gigas]|uniref:E3 ubiquitin-protein ligase TRIM71-like n=1 Tax=Magallana gigas TaxID=29159 RepID=UPI0033422058